MIFQVLTNIKHNGEIFPVGKFFEGEKGEFIVLVKDGALKMIEGAKTIEQAKKIISSESVKSPITNETVNTFSPQKGGENTFGPKNEEEVKTEDLKPETITLKAGEVGTGDLPPESGDNL